MKAVTPWLWGFTALLALNGLRRPWPAWRYESGTLLLCAALPVVVMARYFWHGITDYSGSVAPDGWAYIAYGQYLWEYQRDTEGGLAPLYQFAAHLSNTRFIASALLGFFSPLVSTGDTQIVSSLFQAWTLFSMACAVAFFWFTETTKLWMVITATILSTVAGWIANLIWANNFDNGLALIYLPAFTGIVGLLEAYNWRWWILLGSMLASLAYTYPELAPLIVVSAVMIALPKIWRERGLWRTWLGGFAVALIVAFVLALPVLNMLAAFVRNQLTVAMATTARPGEGLFRGLINPQYFPAAFWGLGGEHQILRFSRTRNLLAIALTAITVLGLVDLLRRRKWGLVAAVVFLLSAALYFIIRQQYSYAAYKLIAISWWAVIIALVTGVDWAIYRVRRPTLRRGVVAGFVVLLLLNISQSNHTDADTTFRYINSPNQQLSAEQFRQLRRLKAIIGSDAVLVLVNDWLANEWAVYYLRDIPIDLTEYRMYMAQAHVLPLMHRAQAVSPEQAHYILTDTTLDNAINTEQHWQMVWSGGPYRLWRPKDTEWATVTNITNANGLEQLEGQRFFWVGQGPTTIEVLAAHAGVLQLSANMLVGPSLPEQADRRVQVAVNEAISQTLVIENGHQVLAVPAVAGENRITLTPLDKPSVAMTKGGDPRPLLLGVKGLEVILRPESARNIGQLTLRGIENRNGLERVDGEQFLWVGQGTTVLHILSNRPGTVQFSTELRLGPSLPDKTERRVQIATDHGYQAQMTVRGGTYLFAVPVTAGTTDVLIMALDIPSRIRTDQGDQRPLLFGLKGLRMWFQEH
jgi:hypothetical protein